MTSPIDGEAPTEHEVPSPASQKLEIDALQLSEPMKEGDAWYLIEAKWWQSWKEYVNMISSSPPGPIDNSPLLNDKNELLGEVSERNDFILLPERTWEKLLSWYGGGPVIGRKVIKTRTSTLTVEIRPLVVNVVYNKETFPIEISKADTTGKLKEIICREKNLNADEVRVWDYYENRKLKVLSDLDERIDDAQILHQQSLLVEAKNADGSWPEEDKRFNDYYGSNSLYGNNNRRPTKPGLTGLNNLGNTCFMNSSLQCLSNTIPLTQFFITNEYAKDINTDNPLGMKGRLAEEFARLVRELWSGQNIAVAPREFKSKLEGFAPQFSGYQQHDSQELLAFLLDGLHEDLNRIKKKQYVEMKEADGRSDDEVAREAWGLHKSRNDSIVVDWFQGQLKSTLVCPECNKISVTFDPFMYLSLPLPMKTTRTVVVTFFPIDGSKPPTKYGVKLPKFGTIANLKSGLAELCGIPAEGLVVTEVYNSRFFKKFNDSDAVDGIQDRDIIHAYEIYVPTESESEWEVLYCPVYQLRDGGGYSYQRKTLFGMPFVISLAPKSTYQALYQQILQYVQRYLKVSVEDLLGEQPESQSSDDVMSLDGQQSQTEMADASSSGYASDDSDGMDDSDEDSHLVIKKNKGVSRENPARTSNNSRLFELLSVDSYGQNERPIIDDGRQLDLEDRQHLAIYWNPAFFSKVYDSDLERDIKEHPSAREDDPEANSDITLDKCLELFAATERLGPDDPWYCNKCKEHRQATKKFDLWSAPPVLVIHLKRFSYRNKYWREKLETQVNYPLRGLDLTNHLISKPANAPIYDLYAVSNHYGSMGGGHYTAYALNKETNKWYKFDDSYVTEVEESHVVSSSAYVLFYRRRDTAVPVPNEVSNNNNNGSPSNTTTTTTSSYADDDTDEDM